ncbi:MAG: hypothetical protein WC996_09830 [Peptostreptococcales bacterium]
MKINTLVEQILKEFLTQDEKNKKMVNFDEFPKDVLKTLEDEYGHYYKMNFDWNKKQDEFKNKPKQFQSWMKQKESEEFLKNIDTLIRKTREDLIIKRKQNNARKTLKDFEELIIPVLGNEVLVEPLTEFMALALMRLHSVKELEQAFQEAKNVIDKDGEIDSSKINKSNLFSGNDKSINLPNFERFVQKNPTFKPAFDKWKQMFDMELELSFKELNAFRDSTPYNKIKNVYNFLMEYKKNKQA